MAVKCIGFWQRIAEETKVDQGANVPNELVDCHEIIRRGGIDYGGNEEYGLLKCPYCRHVYLYEYEADTIYPNPNDLSECEGVNWAHPLDCVTCGKTFPRNVEEQMKVSWAELRESEWRWVTKETRT